MNTGRALKENTCSREETDVKSVCKRCARSNGSAYHSPPLHSEPLLSGWPNNTLMCDSYNRIHFIKNKRMFKTKHVVCLQHCNPSSGVEKNKIKIEIQMAAINYRRKHTHFYTTEYTQVSKIHGQKLSCKSQINNKSGREKQTTPEHYHYSAVAPGMNIKV